MPFGPLANPPTGVCVTPKRQTRSLLTIAMLVALNRPEELKLHLAAAGNCGVTPDQIKEVLLQAAIYCGLPAANAAFQLAAEALPATLKTAISTEVRGKE